MAEYIDENNALDVMKDIGVDAVGTAYMKDKTIFRRILLRNVRNAIANILKQDMLSLGGDVAVNKGCVNCSVEKSDIMVMGTLRQIKKLINKMKSQVSECPEVAKEIETLLNMN